MRITAMKKFLVVCMSCLITAAGCGKSSDKPAPAKTPAAPSATANATAPAASNDIHANLYKLPFPEKVYGQMKDSFSTGAPVYTEAQIQSYMKMIDGMKGAGLKSFYDKPAEKLDEIAKAAGYKDHSEASSARGDITMLFAILVFMLRCEADYPKGADELSIESSVKTMKDMVAMRKITKADIELIYKHREDVGSRESWQLSQH
jgi:hypothetical protein